MLYASTKTGSKVYIDDYNQKEHGPPFCSCCGGTLIVKRGDFKAHHFAHSRKDECDHWTENMTEWHKNWQLLAPPECREVCLHKNKEKHIADILIDDVVIEVQHSPITLTEVRRREQFYDKMIWIVDGRDTCELLAVNENTALGIGKGKMWWWAATKPVLVDTYNGLVRIKRKLGSQWVGYSMLNQKWHTDDKVKSIVYKWLGERSILPKLPGFLIENSYDSSLDLWTWYVETSTGYSYNYNLLISEIMQILDDYSVSSISSSL